MSDRDQAPGRAWLLGLVGGVAAGTGLAAAVLSGDPTIRCLAGCSALAALGAGILALRQHRRHRLLGQRCAHQAEQHRLLAEHAGDLVIRLDLAGRFLWTSPSVERLLGWTATDLTTQNLCTLVHPEDVERIIRPCQSRLLDHPGSERLQCRLLRADGGHLGIEALVRCEHDAAGRPTGFLAAGHDISDRLADAERLALAHRAATENERMAAIGTLAGGVAHEFNNLNAVVLGHTEFLLRRNDLPDDARHRLSQVREAVDRERSIVEALLTFARGDRASFARVDLRQVVRSTLDLAHRTLTQRRVALAIDLPELPVVAKLPAGALGQVLLNLLLNAADAVDARKDKQVQVILRRNQAGDAAELIVRDNGAGIHPDDLPFIFQPFFSTKGEHARGSRSQPHLKGTGLGLAVCETLVRQLGGAISVDSAPGGGTAFTVSVPLPDSGTGMRPVITSSAIAGGRILVVDDEPGIRQLLTDQLAAAGYEVAAAANGAAGLAELERSTFDAVLLNWSMPVMDGRAVLEHFSLHPERPWPPVLVVTGWNDEAGLSGYRRDIAGVLRKPFTLAQTATAVARVMAGRPA